MLCELVEGLERGGSQEHLAEEALPVISMSPSWGCHIESCNGCDNCTTGAAQELVRMKQNPLDDTMDAVPAGSSKRKAPIMVEYNRRSIRNARTLTASTTEFKQSVHQPIEQSSTAISTESAQQPISQSSAQFEEAAQRAKNMMPPPAPQGANAFSDSALFVYNSPRVAERHRHWKKELRVELMDASLISQTILAPCLQLNALQTTLHFMRMQPYEIQMLDPCLQAKVCHFQQKAKAMHLKEMPAELSGSIGNAGVMTDPTSLLPVKREHDAHMGRPDMGYQCAQQLADECVHQLADVPMCGSVQSACAPSAISPGTSRGHSDESDA